MIRYRYFVVGAFLFITLFAGCKKKVEPVQNEPVPSEISRFVWNGLNDYYLWYKDVDKLSMDYFEDTEGWYKYLNTFGSDHEGLFYDLLNQYGIIDRFSWIVDDYVALENSFSGISKSTGLDFRLVRFSGSDDIFGYVRYVVPGSPADNAGIKRGDLFMEVDGQQLTLTNYTDLLFGQDDFVLGMAEYNELQNSIGYNSVDHSLTAVELQENPVHYSTVIDIGGVPTAYLVYNSFTSDFDFDLNDLFGSFVSDGVQRLILDLRYNGGGSIQSSIYLASMIYTTETSKVFSKVQYNDKLQSYLQNEYGADYFDYNFENTLYATDEHDAAALNSLGLTEVYIITLSGTASASELVINGLEPYIDVIIAGETTTGKNVGSITVKDYTSSGTINPNHKWAMQPIVLKIANSVGFGDYTSGLVPDVSASENYLNLLPFGDPEEPMLKTVIEYITGTTTKSISAWQPVEGIDYEVVADSRDLRPFSREMYIENFPPLKK
ncbi:MAG: hypothetical protein LC649_00465 [Bacteroidales bacterium]|nr:hypothetical protein [Bacteroidales bacterium]